MGTKAGALLWARRRFTIPGLQEGFPGTLVVNTGIAQVSKAFGNLSSNEPGFGTPSRIQVMPMMPLAGWDGVIHNEPYLAGEPPTIHVAFANFGQSVTLNALFWDPHSLVGPGEADSYA